MKFDTVYHKTFKIYNAKYQLSVFSFQINSFQFALLRNAFGYRLQEAFVKQRFLLTDD